MVLVLAQTLKDLAEAHRTFLVFVTLQKVAVWVLIQALNEMDRCFLPIIVHVHLAGEATGVNLSLLILHDFLKHWVLFASSFQLFSRDRLVLAICSQHLQDVILLAA